MSKVVDWDRVLGVRVGPDKLWYPIEEVQVVYKDSPVEMPPRSGSLDVELIWLADMPVRAANILRTCGANTVREAVAYIRMMMDTRSWDYCCPMTVLRDHRGIGPTFATLALDAINRELEAAGEAPLRTEHGSH